MIGLQPQRPHPELAEGAKGDGERSFRHRPRIATSDRRAAINEFGELPKFTASEKSRKNFCGAP
jgi:hypothetical protein